MSESNNSITPSFDRYQFSLDGIASSIATITRLVEKADDGCVNTPTLYPIGFYGKDDQLLMSVNYLSIRPLDYLDNNVKATAITLTEAKSDHTPGKSIVGLLLEENSLAPGKSNTRFMVTDFREGQTLDDPLPSFHEFRDATPGQADFFDDQTLYDVSFNLRALVEPWDVPYPEEQVPETLESLRESRATIPGISYLGQLVVNVEYNY